MKLILCALLLLLTGCNLEPRYCRTPPEVPCQWRCCAQNEITTAANVRWWECLQDPILNALIAEALENNRDLQVAIWRVAEFYARFQVALSPLFPQIGLQATALRERFSQTANFLPLGIDPITPFFSFQFTASYEVDFWGAIRSQAHAAYAEALAAVQNRRTVVLTLVGAVAQSYVTLRELDRELSISFKTLEARREYLELARARFEGGLTSEIEVTQAASAYEETQAVIARLQRDIPTQENMLSLLLGYSSTSILRGREIDQFMMPSCVPAGLPSELLIRRPDILEAELLLVAANAEVGVARAAFFPQISLTGLYGWQSFQLSSLFLGASRAWQIGADLFQPLFTGGRLTGELKIANARKLEALYHYQQVVLNAFREVNDALIAQRQALVLVEVQQRRVEDLKEYFRLAWARYYEGETDYLTVLDAERQLYSTELDLTNAQAEVFLTLVDLYKALGGGWVVEADQCLVIPGAP